MHNFKRLWLLFSIATTGLLLALAAYEMGDQSILGIRLSKFAVFFHNLGGKIVTVASAVFMYWLIDKVVMPYFDIRKVLFGISPFDKQGDDVVRACAALGWFILFAAVIIGFTWGGIH